MKKVGIMGGTFDPIHIGHLLAATAALEAAQLDEVWFIPTASPPLKPNRPFVSAEMRYEMVSMAIANHPHFYVLDMEMKRGGISYSYDTIQALRLDYPAYRFHYIIGSDRIHDLPSWHQAEQLREQVRFIGLNRPSDPLQLDGLTEAWRNVITIVQMPLIEISSTLIRNRITKGQSVRYYVPDAVDQFIRENHLYE